MATIFTYDITARESQTWADYGDTGRVHLTCPRCGTSNIVQAEDIRAEPKAERPRGTVDDEIECWKCGETVQKAILRGYGG